MTYPEEEKNSKKTLNQSSSELLLTGFQREINLVKIGSGILVLSFTFFLIALITNAIRIITEIFSNGLMVISTTFQSLYSSLLVIGIICLSIGLHRLSNYFPNRFKMNFIISYLLLDSVIIFGILLGTISHSILVYKNNVQATALIYFIEYVVASTCITISLIILGFTLNQLKRIDGMNVWLLITPLISIIVPLFLLGSGIPYLLKDNLAIEIIFLASLIIYGIIELISFLELLLAFNRIESEKVTKNIYH